jgi:aryl-alcohol dehydrogenase-like predicted oxidoreductase
MSRGIEAEILPTVRELGIGVTAYGVMPRGLLDASTARSLGASDPRARFPRFQGGNLARNRDLVEALDAAAKQRDTTTAQVALAWVLSRGTDIIPLIGTKRTERLRESLGALDLKLTEADLAGFEAAIPADQVAGSRYEAAQMGVLDSERR